MSDLTEDTLNVSLANPGTDYLAPVDEINKAPKDAIFPMANYPYHKKMGKLYRTKEAMVFYTDTKNAPRIEGKSDSKKRARINAIRHVLDGADYTNKDSSFARAPDELIFAQQILSMNLVKEIYYIRLLILMQKLKSRNKKINKRLTK